MFMQFNVKRTFALILALALCAGMLAGCGGSDGSDSSHTPSNTNTENKASETTDNSEKIDAAQSARQPISNAAELLWQTDDFKIYKTQIDPELGLSDIYSDFHDGLLSVGNNQGQGYIDNTGKVAIPFQYVGARDFSEGLADVSYIDKTENYINAYINTNGQIVIKDGASGSFSEGLAVASPDNREKGYVDTKGKLVVPAKYEDARAFSNGMAAVMIEGYKWGFIDKTGTEIVSPQYARVNDFHDGVAAVTLEYDSRTSAGPVGYINTKGELIIPLNFTIGGNSLPSFRYDFQDGLCVLEDRNSGDRYIYNTNGDVVLELGKSSSGNASSAFWRDGLIIVKITKNYATFYECYDYSGNQVPNPVVVEKFVDEKQLGVLDFIFSDSQYLPGQLFYIRNSDRNYGMSDIDGNIVIEQKYIGIEPFTDVVTFARAKKSDDVTYYYLVDQKGNELDTGWTREHYSVTDFNDGLAIVKYKQGNDIQWYILEIVYS